MDKVATVTTYEQLRTTLRALDRVLLWEHYVIPRWYNPEARIAWRDEIVPPHFTPLYSSPDLTLWWSKKAEPISGRQDKPLLN